MKIWKTFIIFIFLFSSKLAMGQQGYMYSYLDPCTSKAKEIYIDTSNGSVPLTYNGQVHSFTDAELQSGAFQTWIDSVNSQNPAGPCSGIGLSQNTSVNVLVAQNSISVITTVLSTLSTMASMQDVATSTSGMADTLTSMGGASVQGVIQSDEKVSSNNDNNDNNDNNGNNSTNSNNGSGNNSVGSTSNNSNNQNTSNSQGNQTSNTTTGGNSGNQGTNNTTSSGPTSTNSQSSQSSVSNNSSPNSTTSPGSSNITGGIGSVRIDNSQQSESDKAKSEDTKKDAINNGASSSSTTKSKVAAVKKGNLMMNGDLVTIASATGDPSQFKLNASIISSNTKNTFAKGALINFTSYVNNSNVTLFVSYRHKKLTTIFANSMMVNFQKDFFDTFSLMESYKYRKITSTIGANLTIGNIGTSKFQSVSLLGGVFSSFKINPKIGLTTMFVTVYSPYVYYYEGMWYQSGILFVPFTSVDYKITKKFKLNISFSAVQQLNDKAISYQILTGAKCFL